MPGGSAPAGAQLELDFRAAHRSRVYRQYRARLRAAVFGAYGQQCACCGTPERLSIDHVDGDGRAHHAELFGRPPGQRYCLPFYAWLIRQGFPSGYQTLCVSCNSSKGTGPRCRIDHATQPEQGDT